jgi:hypothetical protein
MRSWEDDGVAVVNRLVGVYNADGSLLGELSYFVGKRLGRAHCALCDITHGLVRERPAWQECVAASPVPFETFHRSDQPDALRGLPLPLVAADTDAGYVVLLGPEALDACGGSIEQLYAALSAAWAEAGLQDRG